MNELFGFGRTWWTAIIIIATSFVLLLMGKIEVPIWQEMVQWVFTAAATKSTLVGITTTLKNKGKK